LSGPLRLLTVAAALLLPAAVFGATPPGSATPSDGASLAGQLLIATPTMRDPRFAETVLVMVRHSRDGAFAIVINRPVGEQPVARLLEALGEKSEGVTGTVQVFQGGPVQPEQGFVLHSTDYRDATTQAIGADMALSASAEILRAIAAGAGPKKSLLAFGYAGWAPGQIEGELARNSWFTTTLDPKLVFDEDRDKVWTLAVERRTRDL
jgi:putative transcriptional regulator